MSVAPAPKRAKVAVPTTRPHTKEHLDRALDAKKSITIKIGVVRGKFEMNANVTNRVKQLVTFQVGDVTDEWAPCIDRIKKLYDDTTDKRQFVTALMDESTRIKIFQQDFGRISASECSSYRVDNVFVFAADNCPEMFTICKLFLLALGSRSRDCLNRIERVISRYNQEPFDDAYAKLHGCMLTGERVVIRLVPYGLRLDGGCWQPELLPYAAKAVAGDPSACRAEFMKRCPLF